MCILQKCLSGWQNSKNNNNLVKKIVLYSVICKYISGKVSNQPSTSLSRPSLIAREKLMWTYPHLQFTPQSTQTTSGTVEATGCVSMYIKHWQFVCLSQFNQDCIIVINIQLCSLVFRVLYFYPTNTLQPSWSFICVVNLSMILKSKT